MWDDLDADSGLHKKGHMINLNRFFGGTRFCREEVKRWHKEAFKIEYLALECDLIGSGTFEKLVVKQPAMTPGSSAEASASTSAANPVDK
eukprot:10333720-Lingulodinium_polyedra.AAC.1